ncbi:hypothetical protein [Halobacillus salinus]|uniref:Uncharacterized protein n=1 Tax=Halobacillus salinus TaxID=192814 RepID=A0A4Z0H103_9BACI|nr:hypothetical protein [Halobacillus salinus]TGB03554.1 hypothetical protein E4663_00690 [Halobacillus salinus]
MKFLKTILLYLSVLIEMILFFLLNVVVGLFDVLLSYSIVYVPILFFIFKGLLDLQYWQLALFVIVWIVLRLFRHSLQKVFGDKLDSYRENLKRHRRALDHYDGD